MNNKALPISEFKAHCTEELRNVELGATLQITRHGKVVATVLPPQSPAAPEGLGDWIGSGSGMISFGPDYDPHDPAVDPESWEALNEDAPAYSAGSRKKAARKK
jgi:antitoxin (DNA-binding transcriptional repressor) of toxin-antitoxin stability system